MIKLRIFSYEITLIIPFIYLLCKMWSPSYFAISCDGAPIAKIQEYIKLVRSKHYQNAIAVEYDHLARSNCKSYQR